MENSFPKVNGEIRAVIPDNNGGWYIGGGFTLVGSLPRKGLAHILSDGSVDTAWNPNVAGGFKALAKSNSILYAGGSSLVAIDIKTGNIISWTPNVSGLNSWVYDIKVNGNNVYITGRFAKVGNSYRNSFAAIDKFSGIATDWDPAPYLSSDGSSVVTYETDIIDNVIYVTGNFVKIGGQSRNHLAAIDLTTGKATSWNPIPNIYIGGNIYNLKINGTKLYVGGDFGIFREGTIYDSKKTIYNLAAFDIDTAELELWNPRVANAVYALAVDNSSLYAGGRIRTVGGEDRNYLAAIDKATGNLSSWNPNPNNHVRSLYS